MAAAGLPFRGIFGGKIRRLPGAGAGKNLAQWRNLLWNLRDLVMIAIGTFQAVWILVRFRPDVIFNKSGPPGFPVGFAAWLLRIPMVLHEPDVNPGLSTRVMGRWATAIATGFPTNLYPPRLQPKLIHTGNPVQPAILQGDKLRACQTFGLKPDQLTLLVVGGSQGAKPINDALVGHLSELLQQVQILHVTGKRNAQQVEQETAGLLNDPSRPHKAYHIEPFLDSSQMADAYAAADIVVARAGANTIAELAALAKPTILVPNVLAAPHQLANAKAAASVGAVDLASEDPAELHMAITQLVGDQARRASLSQAIQALRRPQAARAIAEVVVKAGGAR